MAVLKCHYFQWLHKTTELGLVASRIVAAQSLIENQTFSTLVKGAQQITEHRAEPHWVEGLLVHVHQKLYIRHLFIYQICHMLILFSFLRWIVSSAQLERRILCKISEKPQRPQSRAWVETSLPQKAPPDHFANYHLVAILVELVGGKYDLVSHTLSVVNLSFLNSSIHPP